MGALLHRVQRIETLNLNMDSPLIALIPSLVCSRVRSLECWLHGQNSITKLSEFGALEELTLDTNDEDALRYSLRELTEPLQQVRKLVIVTWGVVLDEYIVRRIIHCFPRLHTLTLKGTIISTGARAVWDKSALKDVELV